MAHQDSIGMDKNVKDVVMKIAIALYMTLATLAKRTIHSSTLNMKVRYVIIVSQSMYQIVV